MSARLARGLLTAASASAWLYTLPSSHCTPPGYEKLDFSRHNLSHHLLHTSLSGPEKLEHYSLSLSRDKKELLGEFRLGGKACGHPAYIHGGAIATVFDDAMGMLFLSSGLGTGFTANLNVNYRKPIPAGTTLTIACSLERVEIGEKSGAKKVYLVARMVGGGETGGTPPVVYADATSLFVVKSGSGMWREGLVARTRRLLGF